MVGTVAQLACMSYIQSGGVVVGVGCIFTASFYLTSHSLSPCMTSGMFWYEIMKSGTAYQVSKRRTHYSCVN